MDDKHLKMCILVAGYRNSFKDFMKRPCEDISELTESIKEYVADVKRIEEHFKINEEKGNEQRI